MEQVAMGICAYVAELVCCLHHLLVAKWLSVQFSWCAKFNAFVKVDNIHHFAGMKRRGKKKSFFPPGDIAYMIRQCARGLIDNAGCI
jgi:hypothetical protein